MKTLMKSLLTVSLLLASTTASAQCAKLEKRMNNLISEYSEEFCINKTINEMRDPAKPERPLQSKCEIYYFTIKKKSSYQRELLEEILRAMETEGREDPNCYSINTMSGQDNIDANRRRVMIGENADNFIELGKDYENYWNVNAIDTTDTTKSHRYAYAVEWREKGKNIDVRYIVTYAKIPSATTTITQPSWPIIDLGRSRIPKNGPIQAENKARAYYLGKEYSIQSLDSLIHDAQQREKETYKKINEAIKREGEAAKKLQKAFVGGNSVIVWSDSLVHEYDPVTDAVIRLQQGKSITSDDLLCNDNILLIFSQLKQQYLAGKNTEFNAISIYTLCRRARDCGFFTGKYSKEELAQLKRELSSLIDMTPKAEGEQNVEERIYLGLALSQLEKIQQTDDVP